MDGLSHGLQEQLVVGVKAPAREGLIYDLRNSGLLLSLLPLCDIGELHALFQKRLFIL